MHTLPPSVEVIVSYTVAPSTDDNRSCSGNGSTCSTTTLISKEHDRRLFGKLAGIKQAVGVPLAHMLRAVNDPAACGVLDVLPLCSRIMAPLRSLDRHPVCHCQGRP
jgi:hypothetical protein